MREMEATPRAQRYLLLAWQLSEAGWKRECKDVAAWLASNPDSWNESQRERMSAAIATPLRSTERPIVILHCYADVPSGTQWDTVFEVARPEHHEPTRAVARFSVVYHRAVEYTLVQGWHQVAVLDFPDGCPGRIEALPLDLQDPKAGLVGLCRSEDFPEIRRQLMQES